MCSPKEIIEISHSEGEIVPPPEPLSTMSLLKKATDLPADKNSTGKVNLSAVNSLINEAMDLQNQNQEHNYFKPGDHSQTECLSVVGNVTSSTNSIVEIENPSPTDPAIDVPQIKTENITGEDLCSSAQVSPAVMLDGPYQTAIDFLPDTLTSCAVYLVDCAVVSSQSADTPDIVTNLIGTDDSTEILDKNFQIDSCLSGDLGQSTFEEARLGSGSSTALLDSGKGTALSRELTRIQSTLCSKTWTVSTQKARLKKGEFKSIFFFLEHNRPRANDERCIFKPVH